MLDDLDVRASDILQTNGVIWVEGVSDRIYLRHWIKLLCEEVGIVPPAEGLEYTFLEYGGRCLSHYGFSNVDCSVPGDDDLSLLIPALAISRNHVVVMDSDKGSGTARLSETKERVIAEAARTWVTMGREVENYLPRSVAEAAFGQAIGQYGSAGKKHHEIREKPLDKKAVAIRAVEAIDADNWKVLDVRERINELLGSVLAWNRRLTDIERLSRDSSDAER